MNSSSCKIWLRRRAAPRVATLLEIRLERVDVCLDRSKAASYDYVSSPHIVLVIITGRGSLFKYLVWFHAAR